MEYGESVNCKRTRTQTTSRSICSLAIIGRERSRVCPAQPDWLITSSVLSLHRPLIWPSTVLYFSGTGEFSELRRPPAEISVLSFLRRACENSLLTILTATCFCHFSPSADCIISSPASTVWADDAKLANLVSLGTFRLHDHNVDLYVLTSQITSQNHHIINWLILSLANLSSMYL